MAAGRRFPASVCSLTLAATGRARRTVTLTRPDPRTTNSGGGADPHLDTNSWRPRRHYPSVRCCSSSLSSSGLPLASRSRWGSRPASLPSYSRLSLAAGIAVAALVWRRRSASA
ncbi:hypothetical protein P3T29_006340 [Kitasatospora sp. MAP5-34]|nr:hypothetical protein [Kitasatospora sp. MAP5-34]